MLKEFCKGWTVKKNSWSKLFPFKTTVKFGIANQHPFLISGNGYEAIAQISLGWWIQMFQSSYIDILNILVIAENNLLFPLGLTGLLGSGDTTGTKGSICLSSCIFSLMGLRTPQEIFRKPSTTTSPSSPCYRDRPIYTCTVCNHSHTLN